MNALALPRSLGIALAWLVLAQEAPVLRVVTPFDGSDVARLEEFWSAHAVELGAKATFERVLVPGRDELGPDALLLGFERGNLEQAARDGALAPAIVTFAQQSWAPVWSVAEGGPPFAAVDGEAAIDSFERLTAPELAGRIHLRSVTDDSSEGLLLAELAARLELDAESGLPRLVLASYDAGTIVSATTSLDALLRTLPPGGVTIAPVRAAVLARRAGLAVTFAPPREGFLSLSLAAAITSGSRDAVRAWFAERFERDVAPRIVRALELEPPGTPDPDAPEWIRLVAAARSPVEHPAAREIRTRLARLYGSSTADAAPSELDWVENLIDTVLLTIVVVAALVLWRRERDRKGDA
jgi:hypothetical protein